MKNIELLKNVWMMVLVLFTGGVWAQSRTPVDTTIILDPAMFTPADTGYFASGVYKDLNSDGQDEFYNGCADAYGDADHKEAGTQNGWEYKSVIIFNDCDTWIAPGALVENAVKKQDDQPEGWPANWDFIQITKLKDIDKLDVDSTTFGYIKSPAFTNLKSLSFKISTDNSINPGRDIFTLIEASRDGETWSYLDYADIENDDLLANAYIIYQQSKQGGDIVNYSPGNAAFDNVVALSEDADSIMLRMVSFPDLTRNKISGERINVWRITIEAQTVVTKEEEPNDVLAIEDELKNVPFIIQNDEFVARYTKSLFVYSLSGVLIGEGKHVGIPCKGLYVVKTAEGYSKKFYIR